VLDDATSSVDATTEREIKAALRAVMAGRTTFVIAHRLATVREADRILFFKDGEVAESGSWDELLARDGGFAELARTQLLALPKRARPGKRKLRLVWSRAA
jgi:ATP-binding cassette subfamily B protein